MSLAPSAPEDPIIHYYQSITIMQNYVIWTETVLLFILKQKISMKISLMMLKKDLIHEIMSATPLNAIDHYLQEK